MSGIPVILPAMCRTFAGKVLSADYGILGSSSSRNGGRTRGRPRPTRRATLESSQRRIIYAAFVSAPCFRSSVRCSIFHAESSSPTQGPNAFFSTRTKSDNEAEKDRGGPNRRSSAYRCIRRHPSIRNQCSSSITSRTGSPDSPAWASRVSSVARKSPASGSSLRIRRTL